MQLDMNTYNTKVYAYARREIHTLALDYTWCLTDSVGCIQMSSLKVLHTDTHRWNSCRDLAARIPHSAVPGPTEMTGISPI